MPLFLCVFLLFSVRFLHPTSAQLLLFCCLCACTDELKHIENETPLFSPGVQSSSLGNKRSVWIKENVERKPQMFIYSNRLGNICHIAVYLSYMRHGEIQCMHDCIE